MIIPIDWNSNKKYDDMMQSGWLVSLYLCKWMRCVKETLLYIIIWIVLAIVAVVVWFFFDIKKYVTFFLFLFIKVLLFNLICFVCLSCFECMFCFVLILCNNMLINGIIISFGFCTICSLVLFSFII